MNNYVTAIGIVTALGLVFILGCGGGPTLGDVHGTVTVDGQPVEGLTVTFEPQGGGPRAIGTTKSDGSYTLAFPGGKTGAAVGNYTVRVSVFEDEESEGGGPDVTIPAKYNAESQLTTEVKAGDNTFDVDITSN